MKYGLYDSDTRTWLSCGDDTKGPNTYDDYELARAAATVATKALDYQYGRIRAMPMRGKSFKRVGQMEAKLTGEEAIRELEKKPWKL